MGDPWDAIAVACNIEAQTRLMEPINLTDVDLPPYWADICRLLVIFQKWKIAQCQKINNTLVCNEVKDQMSTKSYNMFIDAKLDALTKLEEK
jgi:hypothetical protein